MLSAACKKHWRFVDAIYGVIPLVGMVTRKKASLLPRHDPENLKELALQVISTQISDEFNILRLIGLAVQQGISCFKIKLPYELTQQQLKKIQQKASLRLTLTQQNDRLYVQIFSERKLNKHA
ncbi:MAG: hypothetical protein XXXJIFNMEKO3_01435 [Candidatus Erwinia impunctatus]|nr:hypothetical protein XXXJIFNMEKO_01435 [Culicoides impunctatus]